MSTQLHSFSTCYLTLPCDHLPPVVQVLASPVVAKNANKNQKNVLTSVKLQFK